MRHFHLEYCCWIGAVPAIKKSTFINMPKTNSKKFEYPFLAVRNLVDCGAKVDVIGDSQILAHGRTSRKAEIP